MRCQYDVDLNFWSHHIDYDSLREKCSRHKVNFSIRRTKWTRDTHQPDLGNNNIYNETRRDKMKQPHLRKWQYREYSNVIHIDDTVGCCWHHERIGDNSNNHIIYSAICYSVLHWIGTLILIGGTWNKNNNMIVFFRHFLDNILLLLYIICIFLLLHFNAEREVVAVSDMANISFTENCYIWAVEYFFIFILFFFLNKIIHLYIILCLIMINCISFSFSFTFNFNLLIYFHNINN